MDAVRHHVKRHNPRATRRALSLSRRKRVTATNADLLKYMVAPVPLPPIGPQQRGPLI